MGGFCDICKDRNSCSHKKQQTTKVKPRMVERLSTMKDIESREESLFVILILINTHRLSKMIDSGVYISFMLKEIASACSQKNENVDHRGVRLANK